MSNVKVTVDLSGIKKKLNQQNFNRGRYAMANQMLADMTPFVPALEPVLKTTGVVSADGKSISWNTPYARAQFYGSNGYVSFHNYTTPGTGKRWDLKAKGMFMSDWIRAFTKGAGL